MVATHQCKRTYSSLINTIQLQAMTEMQPIGVSVEVTK